MVGVSVGAMEKTLTGFVNRVYKLVVLVYRHTIVNTDGRCCLGDDCGCFIDDWSWMIGRDDDDDDDDDDDVDDGTVFG